MLIYKERFVAKVGTVIDVYLENGKIGTIYRVEGGYQYQVNKKNKGNIFKTIQDVKNSLGK